MPFTQYAQKVVDVITRGKFCLGSKPITQAAWLQAAERQLQKIKARQGSVFVLGNGGSAAIAAHCQVDLINMLGVRAVSLQDSALLTCFSNDFGYEQAYALLLQKLAQPGDLLIVISSSGGSENLVQAIQTMEALGGAVLSLTGFEEENSVRRLTMEMGGLSLWIPATHYGQVETAHQLILHTLVDGVNDDF